MFSSINRTVAGIFGVVYLLVGLLGFLVTGGVAFFATSGGLLLGIFEVNPFHNVAHLLIGAVLLVSALISTRAAKGTNVTIGAAYLLLGIVGFFLAGTAANVLALNTFDHFLHLASAIVLLGVGLTADRASSRSGRTAMA
jgi:beta-lactamase regulating signal transducer with metallopeptidase domain